MGYLWILLVVYVLSVGATLLWNKQRKAQAASRNETLQLGVGDYLMSRITKVTLGIFLVGMLILSIPGMVQYADVFRQPLWQKYVWLMEHPVTEAAPELYQQRASEFQDITRQFEQAFPGFNAKKVWRTYQAARFLCPIIFLLAIWFFIRYLIGAKAASRPGSREGLLIIQLMLVMMVAGALTPRLLPMLPLYVKWGLEGLAVILGMQAAVLTLLLAILAVLLHGGARYKLVTLPALILLVFSVLNFVTVAYPHFGRKAVEGQWGQTYGALVEQAQVKKVSDAPYPQHLVSFDANSIGPHPTGIKVRVDERIAFLRSSGTQRYCYFQHQQTAEERWVDVAGDTLLTGRPMYPSAFHRPDWFHTPNVPAGAVIYRIGGYGGWNPAFPPFRPETTWYRVNQDGELWVDVNDTVHASNTASIGPGDNGLAYHLDNEGRVEFLICIQDITPDQASF